MSHKPLDNAQTHHAIWEQAFANYQNGNISTFKHLAKTAFEYAGDNIDRINCCNKVYVFRWQDGSVTKYWTNNMGTHSNLQKSNARIHV